MSCLQRELVLLEGSFLVQSVHHEAFKSHERPTISNYYANIFTFLSKITKNLKLKIIFISMNVDKSQFIHYALDHIHVFIDGFVSFGCRGKLAHKTHDSSFRLIIIPGCQLGPCSMRCCGSRGERYNIRK